MLNDYISHEHRHNDNIPAMKKLYSTRRIPPDERLTFWSKQSSNQLFPMEVETDEYGGQTFFGTMVSQQAGPVTIYEIKAQAHNVHHPIPTGPSDEQTFIVVMVQVLGESHVSQGGHNVVLKPGDITLIDSAREFELRFPEPVKVFLLQVPWDAIHQDLISPQRITGLAIPGGEGIGCVVSNFLITFIKQAPRLSQPEASSLTRSLIETLNIAALSYLDKSARESTGCRAFQLHQIRLYLEEHLRETDLSVEQIAEAHGITERYLHKLFEAEGVSVSRLIWLRRLERCKRDIENSYFSGKSITEIAYSWGFSSSSHFSRIFKERFGKSPRDIRAAAAKQSAGV
jgi:AraC-like DNA-binding protein